MLPRNFENRLVKVVSPRLLEHAVDERSKVYFRYKLPAYITLVGHTRVFPVWH
jgi:hypothetical protein